MEQIETQILTQHKDARGDRSTRGGLGIMKDIAKKAVPRNKECGTLYERLINDPFYAYTAARGPDALGSRIHREGGPLHHPQFRTAARLTLVPPQEDVKEVHPDDVFVAWRQILAGGAVCGPIWELGQRLATQSDGVDPGLPLDQRRRDRLGGDALLCGRQNPVHSSSGRNAPLPAVVGVTSKPIPQLRETGSLQINVFI